MGTIESADRLMMISSLCTLQYDIFPAVDLQPPWELNWFCDLFCVHPEFFVPDL